MTFPSLSLDTPKMGFAHLFSTDAAVAAFKTRFNISHEVNIEYYPEGDIENDRRPRIVFFFPYGNPQGQS